MFTRKMQTISQLGVKVKGEGRNYKLVECAMRRCVSVWARSSVHVRSCHRQGNQNESAFPSKRREKVRETRDVS